MSHHQSLTFNATRSSHTISPDQHQHHPNAMLPTTHSMSDLAKGEKKRRRKQSSCQPFQAHPPSILTLPCTIHPLFIIYLPPYIRPDPPTHPHHPTTPSISRFRNISFLNCLSLSFVNVITQPDQTHLRRCQLFQSIANNCGTTTLTSPQLSMCFHLIPITI
jgi:hypothetical protein